MTPPCRSLRAKAPSAPALIIPLTDLQGLREAGIAYPDTEHAWRWLFRMRTERGLEKAFVRIGRRVCVDVPRYLTAVRQSSGA